MPFITTIFLCDITKHTHKFKGYYVQKKGVIQWFINFWFTNIN